MNIDSSALTKKILIAMVAGILAGLGAYLIRDFTPIGASNTWLIFSDVFSNGLVDVVGKVFVNSLKVLVVPLVFVSLVCGVASLKDASSVGVMSVKTLGLYFLTTALAISLALILASVFLAGAESGAAEAVAYTAKESPSLKNVLIEIFPVNIVDAMANSKMLPIIVFAILFGLSINQVGEQAAPVLRFFEALDKVIMQFVGLVMHIAPYGVFCLLYAMFEETGWEHITKLVSYFFTVFSVLILHIVLTMSALLVLFTGLNPLILLSKMRELWLFAFSTASSSASIPLTMNTVKSKLGVKDHVAAFTVPLGATINMDGTAIMQGVATVFIANVYGIDIGITGYLAVIATATLASVGTAGVPGVGLITLAMVLEQAGLPVEGIALIIGVDRLLDMIRTAVNVTGDAIVSTIVAKSENQLDEQTYKQTH